MTDDTGSDKGADGAGSGGDKATPVAPVSLDAVHDLTLNKLEDSDEGDQDDTGDAGKDGADKTGAGDNADGADVDGESGTKPGGEDTDGKPAVSKPDGAEGDDDDKADEDDDQDDADDAKDKDTTRDKPAPELDTDITKPGEGKIAVKDTDGTTYYLNNAEELPDDFEPENYKQFAIATQKLWVKAQDDAQDKADAEKQAVIEANAAAVKSIQDNWESDITRLTDSGVLPKDETERQAVVDGVWGYMKAELKKGITIDSWEQAYKAYSFDQRQAKDVEEQKKIDAEKKRRGGMVQGGNAPAGGKTKTIEGPPMGVGLDRVHERTLAQL